MNLCHGILLVLFCSFEHSVGYKNYTVQNPELCSRATKRSLQLGSGSQSGLVVYQKRLSDHQLVWQEDFKCSFDVKAKSLLNIFMDDHVGIFAVIQSMKLRRSPTTFECIDYIQFKSSDNTLSEKYCGNIDAAYAMDSKRLADMPFKGYLEDEEVDLTSFHEEAGKMTVYIFIDKMPLLAHEETDIKIAFTSYRHCAKGYRMCSNDKSKCISTDFFNDGIINCPYFDCVDEDGCKSMVSVSVDKPLSIGSHILIGSGTSLLISFVVFVCCIYNCRKYGKLCWSEDFSRPQPANVAPPPVTTAQSTSNTTEQPNLGESDNLTAPSAPPLSEDKDLPPSYESLFPSTR